MNKARTNYSNSNSHGSNGCGQYLNESVVAVQRT